MHLHRPRLLRGDVYKRQILYSVTVTLLIMCVMYTKQKLMTAKEFGAYVMKGVSSMLGLVILLVLSFAIGRVIKGMGTGQFLSLIHI